MSVFLASIPNSRIKPRPSESSGLTKTVTLPAAAGNVLIAISNSNRTGITLRNESLTEDFRYDYFDNPSMATEGFLVRANDSVDLSSPQSIWGLNVGVNGVVTIDLDVSVDEGSG